MAARLAEEWFAICGGCEVTILDIGEPLLDVLKQVEIVHMPVLMDHKLYGQTGEGTEMEIPAADVGLISGGIRSEEHKKLAQEMRKKCKILISLVFCACFGAIPPLATSSARKKCWRRFIATASPPRKMAYPTSRFPRSPTGYMPSMRWCRWVPICRDVQPRPRWWPERWLRFWKASLCPCWRRRAFAMSVPPSAKRRQSRR